jgi:pimeloyl-ACP methyl ester carboxylesterase/DNA-binding CsgD family transcriptional regulator
VEQEIRFCVAPDGVRLAWAKHGAGPPIVRAGTWLTHLEFDVGSPVWRHWLEGLGERHTLVRYDERGCGLSDRDVEEFSLEHSVTDLEAVVDATGFERFTLLGISQGAAAAVAYAVRHPERIERIVLYGGYIHGRGRRDAMERRRMEALISVIGAGWEDPDPAFRRVFTMRFLPEGTEQQMAWYDELQHRSTTAETAARIYQARSAIDISDLAPRVTAQTLVVHATGDRAVPFHEGRLLASMIPNARLVPLESINHILLPDEPAWSQFLAEVHDFLDSPLPTTGPVLPDISNRERDVLELVAQGLDNEEIAARLFISVRTVERHLSNVYTKLGVSGKAARAAAAASFARQSAADA